MMTATMRMSTASRPLNCSEDLQEIDRLAHVVYPDDRRAAERRGGGGGERAVDALASLAAGEMSDELLARGADHDRGNARQLVAPREDLEIVVEGLREPDSGIDEDLIESRAAGAFDRRRELAQHVVDDVVVFRERL